MDNNNLFWSLFTLSTGRVNVDVTWSRVEVLVSANFVVMLRITKCECIVVVFSVHHPKRMYPWFLSGGFRWAKSHGNCGNEFEERGDEVWVFLWTWENIVFHRECLAILYRYSDDPHLEIKIVGQYKDASGLDLAVLALNGGSYLLAE